MFCRIVIFVLVSKLTWAAMPTAQSITRQTSSLNKATTIEVPHAFSQAEAHKRLGYLLAYWHGRFGLKFQWIEHRAFISGDIFSVKINFSCNVTHTKISCTVDEVRSIWRDTALSYAKKKLQKYMHVNYEEV